MRNMQNQNQHELDGVGGELLEGSGFEAEPPDTTFEIAEQNRTTNRFRRSQSKKEHADV